MDRRKQIFEKLRANGARVTVPKKVILDIFMANQDRMLSVCDVYDMIPKDINIDNATVYRNIQKYLNLGVLETMVDDNGLSRYTISSEDHHHYLICTECGRIIKFPCIETFWEQYAKENCFEEMHHKIEVYGKCVDCRRMQ